MYYNKDWAHFDKVRVRYHNGKSVVYEALEDAVIAVGWTKIAACRGRPLAYYDPAAHWSQRIWFDGDPVAFYDEMDLRIPVFRVREEAMRIGLHIYRYTAGWRRHRFGKLDYRFRSGPVPGTRKYRGGSGWRRMRTSQEIGANDFLDHFDEDAAEYGVRSRPSRRSSSLPTWWDDGPCKSSPYQSWKRYRRHQWRAR